MGVSDRRFPRATVPGAVRSPMSVIGNESLVSRRTSDAYQILQSGQPLHVEGVVVGDDDDDDALLPGLSRWGGHEEIKAKVNIRSGNCPIWSSC